MATTAGLAAPTRGAGDATRAKVTQLRNLLSYRLTLLC
jgi:hypothetical protein